MDAFIIQSQHNSQGFHQPGFGQTGHTDQKRMPTRQQCHQSQVDDISLAEDDVTDGAANRVKLLPEPFDFGDEAICAEERGTLVETRQAMVSLFKAAIWPYLKCVVNP